jgi:KipI family sensor histidine kinase inhibitor
VGHAVPPAGKPPPLVSQRPSILPLSDAALLVQLEGAVDAVMLERVARCERAIAAAGVPGVVELVPAYAAVAVFYDPVAVAAAGREAGQAPRAPFAIVRDAVRAALGRAPDERVAARRTIEVPVIYGGGAGPDLAALAEYAGLTEADVIARHSAAEYVVAMIGFAPGFPYLIGLPAELAMPRRDTPRLAVPAGSVGIAGSQTGIYPLETPGGWQLIGRTPLRLFDPHGDPPTLLRAGDAVRFMRVAS